MFLVSILSVLLSTNILLGFSADSVGATTSASTRNHPVEDDGGSTLFDVASIFIRESFGMQNSGNSRGIDDTSLSKSLSGFASIIGALVQSNSAGMNKNANVVAMQILSGLGKMLVNVGSSKSHFSNGSDEDRNLMGQVIEIFSQNAENKDTVGNPRNKKILEDGFDFNSLLNIASSFLEYTSANNKQTKYISSLEKNSYASRSNMIEDESKFLLDFLPLVTQVIQSFYGLDGQQTEAKHQGHAWALPPFLEYLHVMWDHFSKSDLAKALYEKSGVNDILKMFKNDDGKLDYDRLFESLYNQSFRRRWIKSTTLYLADWVSYFANPDIYFKYFQSGQIVLNSFLKSQGFPRSTLFDSSQASNAISNLLDHIVEQNLKIKIESRQYVKPAIAYIDDLLKLGKARGMLQFNATEISDRLTYTLNLEAIEPVLKVHRAYRFIAKQPKCDRYVLCKLNTIEQYTIEENLGLITGVSPKIIKLGSVAAAFFISTKTGTPFWSLFNAIITKGNCEIEYPTDCNDFQKGEAKVITEYIHNEL